MDELGGRGAVEAAQPQARKPRIGQPAGHLGARRDHQRDRIGHQAAGDEEQRILGGQVEPLRIVHDEAERGLLCLLREQRQQSGSDREPGGLGSRAQCQCHADGVGLWGGQPAQVVGGQPQQLRQPGEGKVLLGLAPGDRRAAASRRRARASPRAVRSFRCRPPRSGRWQPLDRGAPRRAVRSDGGAPRPDRPAPQALLTPESRRRSHAVPRTGPGIRSHRKPTARGVT